MRARASHDGVGRRRESRETRRDAEFAAFVAGAGGRLLRSAQLLTGEQAAAERLLTAVLARLYADWLRLDGEDPYDAARCELFRRFAHRPWWRCRPHGGELARLSGLERLVVVMRFVEGVAEEQAAAQLALPLDRLRTVADRASATLCSRRGPAPFRAGWFGRHPARTAAP